MLDIKQLATVAIGKNKMVCPKRFSKYQIDLYVKEVMNFLSYHNVPFEEIQVQRLHTFFNK